MQSSGTAGQTPPVATVALDSRVDQLDEFPSELVAKRPAPVKRSALITTILAALQKRRVNWTVVALSLVALVQMPVVALWVMNEPLAFGASTGTVHVESTPAGAEVRMDGKSLGRTPLELDLAAGERVLEVQYDNTAHALPLIVRPGEVMRQRIEFIGTARLAAAGAARGALSGSTASLFATMPTAAGAAAGWITVDAAQTLQILDQGRLIGTTDVTRLMLPAGEHTLDFVADDLGFRVRRTVRVSPGGTTSVPMEMPRAPLAINAQPWATVWLDGEPVGETPIGNLTPTIGRHEVVFRHPDLGERRATVLVTLKAPARIAVDLRNP